MPHTYNQGSDVVAIGPQALGSNTVGAGVGVYNQGNEIVAIGHETLVANTTGTKNVAIGGLAGANGYTGGTTFGNSNKTGSNNTWIGYGAGPNTPSQLSNTTALGFQAVNTASNQVVLGNSSVTQTVINGTPLLPHIATGGISCLQMDAAGNMTGTGSSCGGSGGSGTVTNFTAGTLSPLFTTSVATSTTTPALTFALSNAAANTLFGNFTGTSAGPTFGAVPSCSGASNALTWTSGTGFGCNTISGGGAVSSVSNSDGTLTISPTTGAVVASLALSHANIWSALQTFSSGINLSGSSSVLDLGGSAGSAGQCLVSSGSGVTPSWASCIAGGGVTGTGTTGFMPKWTSSSAIGNSHIDDGVTTAATITSTEPFAVAVSGGQGGTFDATEGTAASATAGHDVLYADSTAHCIEYSANGGSFTCIGSGGGGTSNPATCTASSTTSICITDSTYNASTAGATTTTVSGTFTAGTSGTIGSCSTFSANNGIAIAGAGTAGGLYIGKVVSCTSGALVVTPATTTTVSSSNVVQHDETAAINAAITALGALNGGGDIWFTPGLYLVNGPLLQTSGANAILPMPVIANYGPNQVRIGIRGLQHISTNIVSTQAGAIIQTAATSGNLFSGYDSATGGGFANFTNVWLDIEDMTLVAPDNPQIKMINALTILNLTAKNVQCNTTGSTFPTHSTSACLISPEVGNNVHVDVDEVLESLFYTGFQLGEHSHYGAIFAESSVNGFVFDPGLNAGVSAGASNAIAVDYLWCQACTNTIAAGAEVANINVQVADNEGPGAFAVKDPSNLLAGVVNINNVNSGGGTNPCNTGAAVSGALYLNINWIQCASVTSGNPTATPGGIAGVPVMGSAGTASGIGGFLFQENKGLGTDLKFWHSYVDSSGTLTYAAVNDAYNAGNNWLTVTRTGFVPGKATFAIPIAATSFLASGTVGGNIGLAAGTAPAAAPTSTIQINAPTAVTAYAINLPGAQPTAGNTFLSCTAANPAVCTWAAGSGSGNTTSTSLVSGNFPVANGANSIIDSTWTNLTPASGDIYFVSPGTTARTFLGTVVNAQGMYAQNCYYNGAWIYDKNGACSVSRMFASASAPLYELSIATTGTAGGTISTMDTTGVAITASISSAVGTGVWVNPGGICAAYCPRCS